MRKAEASEKMREEGQEAVIFSGRISYHIWPCVGRRCVTADTSPTIILLLISANQLLISAPTPTPSLQVLVESIPINEI